MSIHVTLVTTVQLKEEEHVLHQEFGISLILSVNKASKGEFFCDIPKPKCK